MCSLKVIGGKDILEDIMISSPPHYVEGRIIEPIQIVEDWNLNYHLASVLKYISRAGRKHNEIKDLRKAIWYLQRRIAYLKRYKTQKG